MQLTLNQVALGAAAFCFFSCGRSNESNRISKSFSMEMVDSIEVAYLGDMRLIEYNRQGDKYLLGDGSYRNYLEVNGKGEILNQNHLSSDGLNAVPNSSGLGYLNGDVVVFTQTDGFYKFQDSTKVEEISIPYPYRSVVNYSNLGVFSEGNTIYYQKPWPQTIDLSMNNWAFYEQLYELPLIESLDLVTGETLAAVRLPENSPFLDGRVHGIPLPTYFQSGDLLLISTRIRPEFDVYKKERKGFNYLETVNVDVPDWVSYDPVAKQDAERFYEGLRSKQIGAIQSILQVDEYYLAVYSKGIPEEKMPEEDEDRTRSRLNLQKANPFFAAVFDREFNQIATDIPFPPTSNTPQVVNKDGELVVSKIAGLSDTEDDGIILYRLKLKVD